MSRIVAKFIVAAPLALSICAAYAQQTPPSGTQGTQGSSQNTQGSEGSMGRTSASNPAGNQTNPSNGNAGSSSTVGNGMNGVNSSNGTNGNGMNGAATPFDSLDTTHQGYLTRQNAATDSWLASHFSQCDADRDGRVTRAEYTACSRAHP